MDRSLQGTEKDRRQKYLSKLKELKLFDDTFFFHCISTFPETLEPMIRIILGRKDLRIVTVNAQKEEGQLFARRGRFDVLAADEEGRYYEIEVQNTYSGVLPQRARFYSALLDYSLLRPSEDYRKLPESFVIIIMANNELKQKRTVAKYTRRNEDDEPLNDGSHIVFVNGESRGRGDEVEKLMHDFRCTEPEDMNYDFLRRPVEYYKRDRKGRNDMCDVIQELVNEERVSARAEGEAIGIRKEKTAMVKEMLKDGALPVSRIAKISGLTISEVNTLAKEL